MQRRLIVIAHNLRSTHNVGALLRTAEGLGVETIYMTGYTPYPAVTNDARLPHIGRKLTAQIRKTALGAESTQAWQPADIASLLKKLKKEDFVLAALEQTSKAISLPSFTPPSKLCLILGNEVEGLEEELLAAVDIHVEIPMQGKKESFNVTQAAAMALYHCRFWT